MMTQFLISLMMLSAPSAQAGDIAPQCAPTGWSCRNDPCCSITDYCHINGTCTPVHQTYELQSLQEISHKLYSLIGLPSTQSAPTGSFAQF